jgi:hypothetical protein
MVTLTNGFSDPIHLMLAYLSEMTSERLQSKGKRSMAFLCYVCNK